jgi:IS605 OrfB family transposase
MKQTLTLVCKLQPTLEQVAKIEATLKAFAEACNYTNSVVKPTVTNKVRIQGAVYDHIRAEFKLSANLAVRVCARVGANRKTAQQKGKPIKVFKPTSADYDARIFAYRESSQSVSLTLVGGREHISMQLGNYQIGKLKGRKPTSAQLCKHRDGLYYIHIQISDETPETINAWEVIGVDFGRRDIACTSQGDKWDGSGITKIRDRFSRVRASLQSKGTKGAKRLLKRMSGRERRCQAWVNHNISRAIVDKAKATGAIIAIEDLTGIRSRTNQQPRNKTERRRSNSWAFYQLRQFLEYKGIQSGVKVIAVNPRYTSQTCHQCLHIGLRTAKNFKCGNCGWHGDADLNGSLMIKILGASVSMPERSVLSCPIQVA